MSSLDLFCIKHMLPYLDLLVLPQWDWAGLPCSKSELDRRLCLPQYCTTRTHAFPSHPMPFPHCHSSVEWSAKSSKAAMRLVYWVTYYLVHPFSVASAATISLRPAYFIAISSAYHSTTLLVVSSHRTAAPRETLAEISIITAWSTLLRCTVIKPAAYCPRQFNLTASKATDYLQ